MSGSREEALFALALEKPVENQITISDAFCDRLSLTRFYRKVWTISPPPGAPESRPKVQERR
jgi:hypothetical protein